MRFFNWKPAPKATFDAPLAPDVAFYAIGDIHGRADLLQRLLGQIGGGEHPAARLIFVGDYVDRGDQSREVLEMLRALQAEKTQDTVCLMGNHERMLLDFLDDPVTHGPGWTRHGGLQTLASFGVGMAPDTGDAARWIATRDALRSALGPGETWLRDLPLRWQSGNVAVVHAGADPALAIEAQADRTLLWGHKDFEARQRTDSVWVVHGHTITENPEATLGRIPVDTGAYATGRLTAAFVDRDTLSFLSVVSLIAATDRVTRNTRT
jgi:serine/threonine protein phosphatase 1